MLTEFLVLASAGIAAHCTSAAAHVINSNRISKLERAMKIQRIELTTLEVVVTGATVVQVIDELLWKKEFKKVEAEIAECKQQLDANYASLATRCDYINDRINKAGFEKLDKLDALIPPTKEKEEGVGE